MIGGIKMGAFDEIKGEGVKAAAMIGGLLAIYVIFLLWASLGIIGIILLGIVIIGGFMLWSYNRTGKIW